MNIIRRYVEESPFQEDFKPAVISFGKTLVLKTIILEGREKAEHKYKFSASNQDYFIPKSFNDFDFTIMFVVYFPLLRQGLSWHAL